MKQNLRKIVPEKEELFTKEQVMEVVFRDRMKYLSLLSSAAVSELQIPLVIIRGLAESALRNPNSEARDTFAEISREAAFMMEAIKTMSFATTTIESEKWKYLTLKDVVDEVLIYFRKQGLDKGISIRIEINSSIQVYSEVNRLKSIIISIFNNAFEALARKEKGEMKSLTVHSHFDSERVFLIFSDTGVGMCPIVQTHILKTPFYTTKMETKFAGLGLSLAQKMAQDLKMDIGFVSEEGKGTTFTLTFPVHP